MYRGLSRSGAGIGFRLLIPGDFEILRKGYKRILRTQVTQKGKVSYAESFDNNPPRPTPRGVRAGKQ